MTKTNTINEALRLIRLYWGYSQSSLASQIEVSQSVISEIESKKRSVSLEILQKYSEHLGIRMSQLLFFAEEIDGQPIGRKGKLIIAEGVLNLLERLKPNEPTEA